MAEKFQFSDLFVISGVIGAARWKPTHLGPTVAPPQLVEFGGDLPRDRAERMIDAFYAHGQYTSVIATLNRVAVLLDNTQKVDIQEMVGKMIRVDN